VVERTVSAGLANTPPLVDAAPTSSQGPDKRLLIGVAAAVVVVLIVGAVVAVVLTTKSDVDSIAVTQRPTEASAPSEIGEEGPTEPQAAGTGEEVRDGDFTFVVNGVRTTDVIVDLTGTNVSADGRTFFASFNTLSDGTTVFEADDEAWLYLGNTVADVAPGASIETEVVFDVPKGTDLESIWLRGGPLSDGVAVGL
jgi:hypothetical protein